MPKLIIVEKPVDCKNSKCVLCDEMLICWWTGEYYSCARCMARMLRQKSNEITKLEKQLKKTTPTYHCPECDEPINIKAWDDGSAGLWSHSKHGPNSVCADCNGDDIQCEECGKSPIDRCAGPNTAEQKWCEEHAAWAGWKVAEGGDNSDTEDEDELICGNHNGGGCGGKGWKLDSGAIQFGCDCQEEEAERRRSCVCDGGDECDNCRGLGSSDDEEYCDERNGTYSCDKCGATHFTVSCNCPPPESDEEEEDDLIICVECAKDITTECDDRSSFDETGEVICGDCFEERERCEMVVEYEKKI
mgnify:CR=1 FL=1